MKRMTDDAGRTAARFTQAGENLCTASISVYLGCAFPGEPPRICLFVAVSSRATSKEEY